jgi:predicted metal-dependent hydrolase
MRSSPWRSFILHQEQAHQRLGEIWAPRLLPDAQALARSARDYCALSAALLEAGLTEFECLHDEAGHYRSHVERHLRAAVRKLEHPDHSRPSTATAMRDGTARA